ncbi:Abi-alpha family protein [Oscillospiraceae bacterium PP1C4]
MNLTAAEKHLLTKMKISKRFPIVRFELRSSKEASLSSIALNHVCMADINATMEQVKSTAALLQKLEQDGIINICYTLAVSARSDYQVYYDSKLYAQLCEMTEEGKRNPNFLFDIPYIKRGVVTFTAYGRQIYLVN